jgi:Mrp family chromosome partitioning ATPase
VSDQNRRHAVSVASRAVRRRLPIVVLCLLIVPAAAVGVSLVQDKEYKATASLLFRQPKIDEVVADGTIFADVSDPNRFAVTYLELIGLDSVERRTAQRVGLTPRKVADSITISPEGQSDVAGVSATASSPSGAARLANAYANTFVRMREDADHSLIRRNIQLLRRRFEQLPPDQRTGLDGGILQDRLQRLELLDDVELGGVQIVDAATAPSVPASPKPARSGLIGLALGALIGIVVALVLERLDRRLKRPGDMEAAFGRPVLAQVPDSAAFLLPAGSGTAVTNADAGALKSLFTKVRYYGQGESVSSVLIASSARREGRTTIASNLAALSAGLGLSVLLLEADFDNPCLANVLELPGERGLVELLAGEATFEQVVQRVDARALGHVREDGGAVDVVVAGRASRESINLINEKRMRRLLARGQEQYDVAVIDSAAGSECEDFIPLAKMVRAVVLVGRLGFVQRQDAHALSEQLREIGVQPAGVVANGVPVDKNDRSRPESAPQLVAAK